VVKITENKKLTPHQKAIKVNSEKEANLVNKELIYIIKAMLLSFLFMTFIIILIRGF